MDNRIEKVLTTFHEFFKDENKRYTEYDDSDIEYFVGCMLYNHFNFKDALDTMKTIDVSYDFLVACEDKYDDAQEQINNITIDTQEQKLDFLQEYFNDVKPKYTKNELYLLIRLEYHVDGIRQRYDANEEVKKVDFVAPDPRSKNPLLK